MAKILFQHCNPKLTKMNSCLQIMGTIHYTVEPRLSEPYERHTSCSDKREVQIEEFASKTARSSMDGG